MEDDKGFKNYLEDSGQIKKFKGIKDLIKVLRDFEEDGKSSGKYTSNQDQLFQQCVDNSPKLVIQLENLFEKIYTFYRGKFEWSKTTIDNKISAHKVKTKGKKVMKTDKS